MDLNWLHSIFYGFVSGFADILPVSAQAHKVLLLKFFGVKGNMDLLNLLIHIAVFAALYHTSRSNLIRMNRARALARVPKRKRKRPLDVRSLMDWSLLKTMVIPVILGVVLFQYTASWQSNLILITLFLFLNGLVLYIPQFLPSSNKDSRTLSRVEGLLMGFGGFLSVLPGFSAVGGAVSVGSVCGVEREFCLDMALMMNLVLNGGMAVYDVLGIVNHGFGVLSVSIFLRYLVTAGAAFGGTVLGIRVLKYLSQEHGYSLCGVYCWGLALFSFILNLMA